MAPFNRVHNAWFPPNTNHAVEVQFFFHAQAGVIYLQTVATQGGRPGWNFGQDLYTYNHIKYGIGFGC